MAMSHAGPNAQSFINHILAGLPAIPAYPDEMAIYTVSHKAHGTGLAFIQTPDQEESPDAFVIAYERGVVFGEADSMLLFSEEQPPSYAACMVIAMLAAGHHIEAPRCPECESGEPHEH